MCDGFILLFFNEMMNTPNIFYANDKSLGGGVNSLPPNCTSSP